MDEVIEAVESAFKAKGLGHAQMPAKIYIFYSKYKGDLRAMPSYLEELKVSAVKRARRLLFSLQPALRCTTL